MNLHTRNCARNFARGFLLRQSKIHRFLLERLLVCNACPARSPARGPLESALLEALYHCVAFLPQNRFSGRLESHSGGGGAVAGRRWPSLSHFLENDFDPRWRPPCPRPCPGRRAVARESGFEINQGVIWRRLGVWALIAQCRALPWS